MSPVTVTATCRILNGDPMTADGLPGRHHYPMSADSINIHNRDRFPDAMTSRTAELLHTMAESAYALETDRLAGSDGNDSAIAKMLPDVAAAMPPSWRYRFAECFTIWAQRLVDGAPLTPRNTAEEMTLHILFNLASLCVGGTHVHTELEEMLCNDPDCDSASELDQMLSGIPACDADFRFEDLAQELFEDFDVLGLYRNDAADRFDEDSILAPRNWFLPFR